MENLFNIYFYSIQCEIIIKANSINFGPHHTLVYEVLNLIIGAYQGVVIFLNFYIKGNGLCVYIYSVPAHIKNILHISEYLFRFTLLMRRC